MPLWVDRLCEDRAALDDFKAWLAKRQADVMRELFSKAEEGFEGRALALARAEGAKKVLDDFERSANMNDREANSNARLLVGTQGSTDQRRQ